MRKLTPGPLFIRFLTIGTALASILVSVGLCFVTYLLAQQSAPLTPLPPWVFQPNTWPLLPRLVFSLVVPWAAITAVLMATADVWADR